MYDNEFESMPGHYVLVTGDGTVESWDELDGALTIAGEDNAECFKNLLQRLGHRVKTVRVRDTTHLSL